MNLNFFISGKIGDQEVIREDLNSFMTGVKDLQWTDNNLYKPAHSVEVKPTFVPCQFDRISNYQPKNINFDSFYLEENTNLNNFQQYKTDIETKRVQIQDKILNKKKEFIDTFFPGEGVNENSDKTKFLELIRINKSKIITTSNLNGKLGKFVGYLNNQPNVGSNYNFEFNKNKVI